MGSMLDDRVVLETIFNNYDTDGKGDLSPIQVQTLHGDLRMGGISLPQVMESMKYVCVSPHHCETSELYSLLQEMDRRYFLIQDFRWEFSMLDLNNTDTVSVEEARWFVQTVHGRHFSRRKWEKFLISRPIPNGAVAFAEIEVMLCNIPDRMELENERLEQEREKEDRLRRQHLMEEEAERERERLKKQREDDRKRREEEDRRLEEERRRRQKDDEEAKSGEKRSSDHKFYDDDNYEEPENPEETLTDQGKARRNQEEEERRRREEEEELRRLKELEEKQRLEEERRKKEEEDLYKDVEKLAKEAEEEEKRTREELEKLKKTGGSEDDKKKLQWRLKETRHRKLRYNLKVAIKSKDRYQLDYSITEFKKENVEDKDMDLIKAERLLKEIITRDNLKRAMTKRELEELEKAIETVKKHGFETILATELREANQLLTRLRRLERIRHEILELKQATVAEIRSYQNPPPQVHKVMTATFLILGHKEKETKEWKAVQALVGKTGKESLKRRCLECKPELINMAAAKRAQALLSQFDLEEVRDVSAGAATFYVWAHTMIEESMDIAAQKEEAAAAKKEGAGAPKQD